MKKRKKKTLFYCSAMKKKNFCQKIHQEQLGRWLSHLSEQEQHVIRLRFGLEGNERHTLAEIGRLLEVSRERVRQVELKALRKLRNLTRKLPSGI